MQHHAKIIAAVSMILLTAVSGKAAFIPVGPQNDVPVATVLGDWGWKVVFQESYANSGRSPNFIFKDADTYVMLAGRRVGSPTFDVLAAALTADVRTYTPLNTPHLANGSQWYYNGRSIGFAGATDTISQNSGPDTNGLDERDRLSWSVRIQDASALPNQLLWGWRSGDNWDLNNAIHWERYVLTGAVPEPGSLVIWSQLAVAIVGAAWWRRRNRAT